MAEPTLFTRIIDGEIPADFVHRDDEIVAIRDINPAAPTHVLVIPRRPIPSLAEMEEEDVELMGKLLLVVRRIAEQEGLDDGYRVVINTGEEGGQTVPHLHVHLLGERPSAKDRWQGRGAAAPRILPGRRSQLTRA